MDGSFLASYKAPESEMEALLRQMQAKADPLMARPVQASFAAPAAESANVVGGLETQGALAPAASQSAIPADLAAGGISAAATLASGLMKSQAIKEKSERDIKKQAASAKAEGMSKANEQQMKGMTSPLSSLIANYRAAIG
jgi:hypothetical protein